MERILVIILFILIMTASAYAEDQKENTVPLSIVIEETGAEFRWEPFRSFGELSMYGQSVIFKPGVPFLLLNYSEKTETVYIGRGENGEILLSARAAEIITSLFTSFLPPKDVMRIRAVILDPGHGGKDPGAVGSFTDDGKTYQLMEKDVVLSVAALVAAELKKQYKDKEIILTRAADEFISLEQRTQIANEIKLKENESILFVSIHANASLNSNAKGFEVWYLPPEYRRELLDESSLDNDLIDVAPILNTMLEEEITVESILLAKRILAGLNQAVGNVIEDRGLKEESWFVVRNAKMPAVLIELGFVTNREEARILNDQSHLMKISEGIYNGISGFIDHFETQFPLME